MPRAWRSRRTVKSSWSAGGKPAPWTWSSSATTATARSTRLSAAAASPRPTPTAWDGRHGRRGGHPRRRQDPRGGRTMTPRRLRLGPLPRHGTLDTSFGTNGDRGLLFTDGNRRTTPTTWPCRPTARSCWPVSRFSTATRLRRSCGSCDNGASDGNVRLDRRQANRSGRLPCKPTGKSCSPARCRIPMARLLTWRSYRLNPDLTYDAGFNGGGFTVSGFPVLKPPSARLRCCRPTANRGGRPGGAKHGSQRARASR